MNALAQSSSSARLRETTLNDRTVLFFYDSPFTSGISSSTESLFLRYDGIIRKTATEQQSLLPTRNALISYFITQHVPILFESTAEKLATPSWEMYSATSITAFPDSLGYHVCKNQKPLTEKSAGGPISRIRPMDETWSPHRFPMDRMQSATESPHVLTLSEKLEQRDKSGNLAESLVTLISKHLEHKTYLYEVSERGRFRLISHETAEAAKNAWEAVWEASEFMLPIPSACNGPDGQMHYVWDRGPHHLELEIIPQQPAEFFYRNRVTDELWGEDYIIGDPLSSEIIERIKLLRNA